VVSRARHEIEKKVRVSSRSSTAAAVEIHLQIEVVFAPSSICADLIGALLLPLSAEAKSRTDFFFRLLAQSSSRFRGGSEKLHVPACSAASIRRFPVPPRFVCCCRGPVAVHVSLDHMDRGHYLLTGTLQVEPLSWLYIVPAAFPNVKSCGKIITLHGTKIYVGSVSQIGLTDIPRKKHIRSILVFNIRPRVLRWSLQALKAFKDKNYSENIAKT
jgi:hypothetical protein